MDDDDDGDDGDDEGDLKKVDEKGHPAVTFITEALQVGYFPWPLNCFLP